MMLLVRHQLRRYIRSRAFWVIVGVSAIAFAYGALTGARWADKRAQAIVSASTASAAARAEARDVVEHAARGESVDAGALERARSSYGVASRGAVAVLPSGPGAALSVGQSDLFPATSEVTIADKTRRRSDRYQLESALTLAAGHFDVCFVVVYLLPLFVLALTYDALGEERDDGTLPLLVSYPVSLTDVLVAKLVCAGLVIGVIAAVVPLTVLALADTLPAPAVAAGYVALTAAYIAVWLGISAMANVFASSTSASAVAVIAAWIVFVLIVPATLSVVASSAVPMPSRFELVDALRADDVRDLDGKRLLQKWYGDHPELGGGDANAADWSQKFVLVQSETMRRTAPIESRFRASLREQYRVGSLLRFASPASVVREAMDTLAGTDTERFLVFRERIEAWNPVWIDWFTARVAAHTPMQAADYDALPSFEADDQLSPVRGLAPALLGLLITTVAAIAVTFVRLRGLTIDAIARPSRVGAR